ncbi:MAG TPA: hypothetical protein VM030_10000 [Acidimicrobiales bacterium]|nr:hypothetical protein [Acidimicrobiales bacterium]
MPFVARLTTRFGAAAPATLLVAGLVAGLVGGLLAGCGADRPKLPTGDPIAIVAGSAEATARLPRARVVVTDPDSNLDAVVTLADPGTRDVDRYAAAVLTMLSAASDVDPFGGQAIRGVSTMRYSVTVDAGRANRVLGPTDPLGDLGTSTFETDVWIDADRHVRRVQLATVPGKSPPPTARGGVPALLTVDFVSFPR